MTDYVCGKCIEDRYLKAHIAAHGSQHICGFCNRRGRSIDTEEVLSRLDDAFREQFRIGRTVVHRTDSGSIDYEEHEGEYLHEVVREFIGGNDDLVEHLVGRLVELDGYDPRDGGNLYLYDRTDLAYVETRVSAATKQRWAQFNDAIRHESRFFNSKAREVLDFLFEDIHDLKPWGNSESAVRTLAPEASPLILRGRISDAELAEKIVANPKKHLGPPPPYVAVQGRMNTEGIPALYGALELDTCIAELRPPVGATVMTGAFRVSKPLRVLDFSILERSVGEALSRFDPDFELQASRYHFLRGLHAEITRPVLPQERSGYLSTQVLAEYLAVVMKDPVDGVVFGSSQVPGGTNIALFSRALGFNARDVAEMGDDSSVEFVPGSLKRCYVSGVVYQSDSWKVTTVDDLVPDPEWDDDDLDDVVRF